jgi:hypothetical protein
MGLDETLKKYFGYDAFRPLQKEIINDALAGRDVFALMPTRREVALFSIAGVVAGRADHRGIATDLADERSGRCAPNQRDRSDVFELDLGSTGSSGAIARTSSR